jgi:hypothetical protein
MEILSNEYALLAMQSALLREVTPALRAVILDLDCNAGIFHVYFYQDGEISEEQADTWDCVNCEASADLGPIMIEPKIARLDYPLPIRPTRGYYAYLRYENTAPQQHKNNLPKVEIKEASHAYAMLAAQSALLGVVTSELRAVVVDFDKKASILYIRFYYDKEASKSLIALWQNAIAEIKADFSPDYLFDGCVERIDYPKEIPFRGRYAYFRKE